MCFNAISSIPFLTLLFGTLLALSRVYGQSNDSQSASGPQEKVSVFFGTTKAMDIDEVKTNALEALKSKGHTVPSTAYCVINIVVKGPRAGCAVLYYDLKAKWQYQVEFDEKGQVSFVSGGPTRHGSVSPNDPGPKMPEGGVKMKPEKYKEKSRS